MKSNVLIISYLLFLNCFIYSQNSISIKTYNNIIDEYLLEYNPDFHTSIKSLRYDLIDNIVSVDSLKNDYYNVNRISNKSFIHRKLFKENLVKIDKGQFNFSLNPLFDFSYGKATHKDESIYNNTRGILLVGDINRNISFYSSFCENQSVFPNYIKDFVRTNKVIPGQGKGRKFKDNGYDYSWAEGLVSYTSNDEVFNLQFGNSKNFIGDGYRSLMLSDNSYSYPFLKITTNVWKIQYTNLFTSFMNINLPRTTYEMGYQKKNGSFHHLSMNIGKKLNIGLFEGIIWQSADSTGTRGFDVNYLNPIIFYRPVEFSLGSPDNAIMGLNYKYRISKKMYFYGQFVLDDINLGASNLTKLGRIFNSEESYVDSIKTYSGFFQQKYGFQLGIKYYDVFKIENLAFQLEYNQVRPYMYAHKTVAQNYSHYYQPLAHPLGANFKETVFLLNYKVKNWHIAYKLVHALTGEDIDTLYYGKNIFVSDFDAPNGEYSYGNNMLQGEKRTVIYNDLKVSYLVNPSTNMNFSVGVTNRMHKLGGEENNTNYVYVSFSTDLFNHYYDF